MQERVCVVCKQPIGEGALFAGHDQCTNCHQPHLFAKNFKVPHLVIDGELDYRVPYYEGVSLFTALQRQNVPSRLILFPDEGHWIGKPQNQRLWWGEIQGWFRKYLNSSDTRASR